MAEDPNRRLEVQRVTQARLVDGVEQQPTLLSRLKLGLEIVESAFLERSLERIGDVLEAEEERRLLVTSQRPRSVPSLFGLSGTRLLQDHDGAEVQEVSRI